MCKHIPLTTAHYTMYFCYCTYFSICFYAKSLYFLTVFRFLYIFCTKRLSQFSVFFSTVSDLHLASTVFFSLLSANHPHRLTHFPVLHRLIQFHHFHFLIPIQPLLFDMYILHCSSPSSSHAFSFLGHPFK